MFSSRLFCPLGGLAPPHPVSVFFSAPDYFLELQKAEVGQLCWKWHAEMLLDREECVYGDWENDPFMSPSLIFLAFTNYRSSSGSTGTWLALKNSIKSFPV